MVTAYALLLASTVAPTELDASALAGLLATQSAGQAVVALANGRTVLTDASGTIDSTTADLKRRNVRFLPGTVAIAYSEVLPDAAILSVSRLRDPDPATKSQEVDLPKTVLAGGKVTYATAPGQSVRLTSLSAITWSLPLKLSAAFGGDLSATSLGVSVKDLDEAEFLRSVAKAIGGRFRTDGKNLIIEANGGELKTRALKTIELASRAPKKEAGTAPRVDVPYDGEEVGAVTVAADAPVQGGRRVRRNDASSRTNPQSLADQLELARLVTNSLSTVAFEKWLNGETEIIPVDLTGQGAIQNSLIRLLKSGSNSQQDTARIDRMLATVSQRAPGQIVLGEGYSLEAALNTVDRRGNSGRVIRLKAL